MDADQDWTDKFISTIESRPALFNKSIKEYSDRNVKEKLWNEVCEIMISNWSELRTQDRTIKGREIQQRWRNLRTCFKRELNEQKKGKSGQAATKRRKYVYFDQLLFLLPTIEDRETVSNISSIRGEAEENENDNRDDEEGNYNIKRAHPSVSRSKKKPVSYEESLLNILQDKRSEEIDEDKSFLLSFVPSFKKLNADQKFEAKVEFLRVMRRIEKGQPSTSLTHLETLPLSSAHIGTPYTHNLNNQTPFASNNYYPSRSLPSHYLQPSSQIPCNAMSSSHESSTPSAPSHESENSCFSDELSSHSEIFNL